MTNKEYCMELSELIEAKHKEAREDNAAMEYRITHKIDEFIAEDKQEKGRLWTAIRKLEKWVTTKDAQIKILSVVSTSLFLFSIWAVKSLLELKELLDLLNK